MPDTWSNEVAPKRVVPECERAPRRAVRARRGGPATAGLCTALSWHTPCHAELPHVSARTAPPLLAGPSASALPHTPAEADHRTYGLNGRGRLRHEVMPPCTLAAYKTPPPSFSRARPSSTSVPSSTPTPFCFKETPPAPPLGHRRATTTAHWPALPCSHRNSSPQRPPPPRAAEQARQWLPCPNSGHHRVLGEHVVEPRYFPGQERRRPRRILAGSTAHWPRTQLRGLKSFWGPICKPMVYL
jgi:hypothetical protein